MRLVASLLLAVTLLGGAAAGDLLRARMTTEDRLPPPPNGKLAPYLGSLADAGAMGYWLALLSRIGGWISGEGEGQRAVNLASVFKNPERMPWVRANLAGITEWAPDFPEPYLYGGVMLYWYGNAPSTASAILEKALAAGVRRWEIPFYLAVYAHRAGDVKTAARWIEQAATYKDAPALVPLFATKLLGDTGRAEDGVALLEVLLTSLPPKMEQFRGLIEQDLKESRTLLKLNRAAVKYREAQGKSAHLVEQLVEAGFVGQEDLEILGGGRRFMFSGEKIVVQ